jgi:hypothetical protein
MRLEDDGVSPEVSRSAIESGKNASICVWERPMCLVAWIWRSMWRDDGDATCFAETVSDVCSRVLIAYF